MQPVREVELLRTGQAAKYFGVCDKTIRTWVDSGKLSTTVTIGGHRRIEISKPTDAQRSTYTARIVATYARVSSRKQVGHRANQEKEITNAANTQFPDKPLRGFVDVGSGLHFKRPGLLALLELCMQRRVEAVVVAYRDRLCRFGFELLEWLLGKYDTRIMVLHSSPPNTTDALSEDLLAVVTVFSARAHGMRTYKRTLEKELEAGDDIATGTKRTKRTEQADEAKTEEDQRGALETTTRAQASEDNRGQVS
jgi:excisionase family DNA binding protein